MKNRRSARRARRGAIAVLAAILIVLFVAMIAFTVDMGYIQAREAQLQRTADAAALAAVQDLVPDDAGYQDHDAVRATVRQYVVDNLKENGFKTETTDIEIGRYDPATIYSKVTLLDSGIHDAVRVTLKRDGVTNARIPLFFARVLGLRDASVSARATAILQKPQQLIVGSDILPFAVPESEWDNLNKGDSWSIYGDGKIRDDSDLEIPGNWGTLDIGAEGNSTSDLVDQIDNGLHQSHLDALYDDMRIQTNTHIDTEDTIWMQGDTGLSAGIKSAVARAEGQVRAIPIYDQMGGKGAGEGGIDDIGGDNNSGNNLEYRVVKWALVEVVESSFKGANNTYVKVKKVHRYNGTLGPNIDLSDDSGIEGAFTSPVLVE